MVVGTTERAAEAVWQSSSLNAAMTAGVVAASVMEAFSFADDDSDESMGTMSAAAEHAFFWSDWLLAVVVVLAVVAVVVRAARYRGRGRGGRGGGGRRSISSFMTEEGVQDLIQRTTQATIASITASTTPTTDDVSVMTTPTGIDGSSTTADPSKRSNSAVPEGNLKRFRRNISKVHMSNIRRTNQAQISLLSARSRESATHTVGYLDEDSHADMHCAGKNCVMLSTTGFSCDVSPFHEQYEARKDVEIVKAATAYQHPSGQVIYIVMNISLWFGNEMEHSLFNGLIARDAGNQLCTDPYDEKGLGFTIQGTSNGQDTRIALERRGNKIGVETFKPLRDDVLQAIQTNSPYVVYLNPESEYPPMFDEQGISSIWLEENDPDSRPKVSELPLDTNEYYDNAIAPSNEAPLFWPHQLYDVAVSLVRDTRRVVATVTNRLQTGHQIQDCSYPGICAIATNSPHQGPVTPEALQYLWGIGHETATRTIDTTMQYAMRHATQPLRRRYRTDLLSLLHPRIRETVHTDTLLSQFVSIRKIHVPKCMLPRAASPLRTLCHPKHWPVILIQNYVEKLECPRRFSQITQRNLLCRGRLSRRRRIIIK
jgi:hypothetical protein